MPTNSARYTVSIILSHWVLALMSFVLLGLGWYIQSVPPATPARTYLVDLHVSLGLTSAILISIQIFLRIVFKPASLPNESSKWQKLLAFTLSVLIYVSFISMLISGYLWTVFSGTPIRFWGTPLPAWGAIDVTLAGFFGAMHGIWAFVLVGLIFLHAGIVGLSMFRRPAIAATTPLPEAQESRELALREAKSLIASKIAQRLARKMRLFGWIGFWLQFVLAFVSGLLLVFSTSGHAFSPNPAGFGEPIYWGGYGFLLLCFAVVWAFLYIRAARKVILIPHSYFNQKKAAAFWFLGSGMLTGILGVLISFVGLALSINLIIAKAISIAPGVMMMDPSQFVRAADILILLMNFNLLVAHLIGTGITLFLSIGVSKARQQFVEINEHLG